MLRRLRARNFRSFVDLQSPPFSRVNVILGPNGAGKSSIKDAITLALSGTATGFETGIGLDQLRTIGGADKRWQLDAQFTFEDRELVLSRADDEGPRSAKQAHVEREFGIDGATARACLESGEFVRLDRKARRKLLEELAPAPAVILPEQLRGSISEFLGETLESLPSNGFDRLYKAAYELRTQAARDVKAIGDLDEPARPEGIELLDGDLDRELSGVRGELEALRKERDLALRKAAPATIDLEPARRALDRTARELAGVQTAIGALPSKMEIARLAAELVAKLARAGETNAAIEAKRRELNEALGIAEGTMRRAKLALEAVTSQRGDVGTCPVCESKLTKVNRGKLETSLRNQVDAAGRERQRIRIELEAEGETKSAAALEAESDALSAKEVRLVQLLDDEKRLAARLLEERSELERLEAAPADPGDDLAASEARELEGRIANGERMLEDLVRYSEARKAYLGALSRKAGAMKRHAALDELVSQLGPTGIRVGAGGDAMFAFSEELNGHLRNRGFQVDLRPALDLTGDPLVNIGGRKIPLGLLSDGERIAFGVAFSIAVAETTGLGIVVVDNFERLDPDAGDVILDTLESSGVQAFVLCVEREPELEQLAIAENSRGQRRMFLLRDGQLTAPGLEVPA